MVQRPKVPGMCNHKHFFVIIRDFIVSKVGEIHDGFFSGRIREKNKG